MVKYFEGHETNVKVKSVCDWLITDQDKSHLT